MNYNLISVRDNPTYLERAVDYFTSKWGAGYNVYNDCIKHSLTTSSLLPRWYLLVDESDKIVGSYGLIVNDFNSRQDLWPWLCALYVEESERGQKLGAMMLEHGKCEAKKLGFETLYLATDHVGYYEKSGFSYIAQCYSPGDESRVYAVKI
jgi:N-acetylglutamate synthase-like GNAT family acetyltransferase